MPKKLNGLEIDILRAIALHYPVNIKEVKRIYYICKSYDMVIKSIVYSYTHCRSVSYYAEHGGIDIE